MNRDYSNFLNGMITYMGSYFDDETNDFLCLIRDKIAVIEEFESIDKSKLKRYIEILDRLAENKGINELTITEIDNALHFASHVLNNIKELNYHLKQPIK